MSWRYSKVLFLGIFSVFFLVFLAKIYVGKFDKVSNSKTSTQGNQIQTDEEYSRLTEEDLRLKSRIQRYRDMLKAVEKEEMRPKLPQVIIIGVEDCGTDVLQYHLSLHPLIKTSENIHFYNRYRDKGIKYYSQHLPWAAKSRQFVVDNAPEYFTTLPFDLPSIIKKDLPKVKLILLLCDPMQRLISGFLFNKLTNPENVSIDGVIKAEFQEHINFTKHLRGNTQQREEKVLQRAQNDKYFSVGMYSFIMGRWRREFGSNLLILDANELKSNPSKATTRVLQFLGLPAFLLPEDYVKCPGFCLHCVRPWWNGKYNFLKGKLKKPGWQNGLKCPMKDECTLDITDSLIHKSTLSMLNDFYALDFLQILNERLE